MYLCFTFFISVTSYLLRVLQHFVFPSLSVYLLTLWTVKQPFTANCVTIGSYTPPHVKKHVVIASEAVKDLKMVQMISWGTETKA